MIEPKPRRTRKQHGEEFRREAVSLFQTFGITAAQINAKQGISVYPSHCCSVECAIYPRYKLMLSVVPLMRNFKSDCGA